MIYGNKLLGERTILKAYKYSMLVRKIYVDGNSCIWSQIKLMYDSDKINGEVKL